jgi:hypothetical protein
LFVSVAQFGFGRSRGCFVLLITSPDHSSSALLLLGPEEALLLLKSLFVVVPAASKRCIFVNQQTLNDSKIVI